MGRALISILFDGIEDPRVERTRRHKLTDVLQIALIGVLVGERGSDDIADYAEEHAGELRRLLELPHGTPSADTIRRVLSAVDGGALNRALTTWAPRAMRQHGRQAGRHRRQDHSQELR